MRHELEPSLSQHVQVDRHPRASRVWDGVSGALAGAPQRGGVRFQRWAAVGALVAAVGVGGAFYLTRAPSSGAPWQRAALETAGDAMVVDLDDGSRLELAARSRVEMVESSASALSVRLNHGRVECDLKPRAGRRFAVLAAGVEVRVTGTRFSVELSPDKRRVAVAVTRGSVEVYSPHGSEQSRRLTAGEQLSIDLSRPTAALATSASPYVGSALATP